MTNELEEVLYLDRMQLMTVAHPADVEVFPNEGMTAEAKPFKLFAVREPHVPARVVDEHGHDVTARIAALDRTYPDDFDLAHIRGYAGHHALTIDLGPAQGGQTLLLTGWTDYAFSSDNVAALQAGMLSVEPASRSMRASGRWRKLEVGIGIPVGRPQTIPLDLSGLLRPGEHEVRLTTNMRVYWDQIPRRRHGVIRRLHVGDARSALRDAARPRVLRGGPSRRRGSARYDYGRVSPDSPWKVFSGSYTREGDVLRAGYRERRPVRDWQAGRRSRARVRRGREARGTGRLDADYLLIGDGFSKEMDVNSASPDTVEPLPFHGMSKYPYPPSEHYPDTPGHNRYREEYNTRQVHRGIPKL